MDQIGRYHIKRELGRGGMGRVYHALDPNFPRDVALKVIAPQWLDDPSFKARFRREAEILAVLESAGIVPVYDFGETPQGQPYMVMRYMPGGSLATRLRRGPLSLDETLAFLKAIAPAIDEAHRRGVIHRDLKPENILLDSQGHPYVADFGLAKIREESTIVSGDGLRGTATHMSPEQVLGELIDHHSDIYAIGVILFQMLTGRLPYWGESTLATALQHVHAPVPQVRNERPDLPPDCETVIARAMAKSRTDRYPSVGALATALEQAACSHRQPSPRRAPSPSRPAPAPEGRRWMPWLAGGPLLVAVALLMGGGWWWRGAPPRATPHPTVTLRPTEVSARTITQTPSLPSPTPTHSPTPVALEALPVAPGTQVPLPPVAIGPTTATALQLLGQRPAGETNQIDWAPNGTMLALATTRGLQLYTSATLTEVLSLPSASPVWGTAFSPDGSLLATGAEDGQVRLWQVGTCPTQSATCGTLLRTLEGHTEGVSAVAFSLDGRLLASGAKDGQLRIWRMDGCDLVAERCGVLAATRPNHEAPIWSLAFAPNSGLLASGGNDNMVRLWDVRPCTTEASASCGTLVATLTGHTDWVWSVAFSPDGTLLASGGADGTLRLWQTAPCRAQSTAACGAPLTTLVGHTSRVRSVAFAPTNGLLASSSDDGTVRLWDLQTCVTSGASTCAPTPSTLGTQGAAIYSVAFSPNGQLLATGGASPTLSLWGALAP